MYGNVEHSLSIPQARMVLDLLETESDSDLEQMDQVMADYRFVTERIRFLRKK